MGSKLKVNAIQHDVEDLPGPMTPTNPTVALTVQLTVGDVRAKRRVVVSGPDGEPLERFADVIADEARKAVLSVHRHILARQSETT